MSGVFGVAGLKDAEIVHGLLDAMRHSLVHHDWYVTEQYAVPGGAAGIGRIGIGIFNREPQPVFSADGELCLVFAGELTHGGELRRALLSTGVCQLDGTDEALLLAAYTMWGVSALSRLQGQYVFALLDIRKREVVLANDRFGQYPTYYALSEERLAFAPEIKALLTHPSIATELRDDALAEYFRFQRLLGTKTLFKGINLLPPASVLRYNMDTGESSLLRYWDLGKEASVPANISLDEAIEVGAELFNKAVSEAGRGDLRIGAYLSGGLDSRMIVGMLAAKRRGVQTFTFGQPGCRDEYYARRIAMAARTQHHFYPYESGHWIQEYAPEHVKLAEGFHSWLHMHGINMLEDVRRHIDINVSGLGDFVWPDGTFTPIHLLNAPDDIAFSSILFELYHQKYTWPGPTYPDEFNLFTDAYRPRLVGLAYESFVAELRAYQHLPYSKRVAAFNLDNHFARYLVYHCVFGRSHIEYRLPYFDLEFFSFASGLPGQICLDRRVQKGIIMRYLPQVARVPVAYDELPLTDGQFSRKFAQVAGKVRRHVARFIAPASAHHASLYADYEGWLRTDLRAWAESILFDQRALDRGIFSRDALMSLWSRHLSGNELWTVGKLASIISFEMTMRSLGM